MAKGQVRGNRETRKPKKDKAEKSTSSVGSQVKLAESSLKLGKKDKS
jgi:BRCT domain type II-containing protein